MAPQKPCFLLFLFLPPLRSNLEGSLRAAQALTSASAFMASGIPHPYQASLVIWSSPSPILFSCLSQFLESHTTRQVTLESHTFLPSLGISGSSSSTPFSLQDKDYRPKRWDLLMAGISPTQCIPSSGVSFLAFTIYLVFS